MLQLNYFLDQIEFFKKGAKKKGIALSWNQLERDLAEIRTLKLQVDKLRQAKNLAAKKRDLKEGKAIKTKLEKLEKPLETRELKLTQELLKVPNAPLPEVPEGNESQNQVLEAVGEPKKFSFSLKDHLELGESLDILDVKAAAKTSGSRFYFLKNEAVELEWALLVWLSDLFKKEGFKLLIPPALVKKEVMLASGFLPLGGDDIYQTTLDELYLVGTAEQSILGYHLNETLSETVLPLRYLGFSPSFRREAGSYGKDIRGIIRTHQFDKLEFFSFVRPEKSEKEHRFLVGLEEKILQALKLPYRKVLLASEDISMASVKTIDLEVWLPSQKRYLEITSCSNCTDWQAWRGNIRYRVAGQQVSRSAGQSKTKYVHTLNGTAAAIGRLLVAIWENYQEKDGSVVVPEVLQPYLTFRKISPH